MIFDALVLVQFRMRLLRKLNFSDFQLSARKTPQYS